MRFTDLTYEEIGQRARSGSMVVVPMGCTEQQGPHVAVGFDTWFAEELCLAAAEEAGVRYGTDALVLPVMPLGPTPEHRSFGAGYLDLPLAIHEALLDAILRSMSEQGFKTLVVWRGCGGHDLSATVDRFNHAFAGKAMAHLPAPDFHEIWCRVSDPSIPGGHADSFATSIALYRHPEWVRIDRVPGPSRPPNWSDPDLDFAKYSESGVIGDPRHASAELGAALWSACVSSLANRLHELAERSTPLVEKLQFE